MPKRILPLTDLQVQKAKPSEKDYKLSDGRGLYLLVSSKGGKHWRFDYTFSGKRKTLSFKSYPEISLADARQRREDARKLLANDVDPGEIIKVQRQIQEATAITFETVAREWFSKNEPVWSDSHIKTIKSRLVREVYPIIGNRPIAEITRGEVIALIRRVEARGVIETADRIKIYCGQIFRYALNLELIPLNPVTDMRDVLTKRVAGHHAAITDPKKLAGLMRAIDEFDGSFVVTCALKIAPFVFVRPGELRQMEWSEIDFDAEQWNIPAEKMKMKANHLVPLSKQVLAVLKELHPLTGSGKYAFPNGRTTDRPMSEVALLAALRRMGYSKEEMTPHGFRATARTILDEVLQVRPDFIEHQLAHAVKDPNGRAYNRTAHLDERKKMMQLWADYLDGLKQVAKVIPLKQTP
ncbi:MAG: integrase arm-type DNA-binding domain-containing protein [Geobacteraceae bacterium]